MWRIAGPGGSLPRCMQPCPVQPGSALGGKCPPAFPASLPIPSLLAAIVFKATFRGEMVAAKEVDLGRSAAVQELFVTVGAVQWRS